MGHVRGKGYGEGVHTGGEEVARGRSHLVCKSMHIRRGQSVNSRPGVGAGSSYVRVGNTGDTVSRARVGGWGWERVEAGGGQEAGFRALSDLF